MWGIDVLQTFLVLFFPFRMLKLGYARNKKSYRESFSSQHQDINHIVIV
jgi:hypothetical protein